MSYFRIDKFLAHGSYIIFDPPDVLFPTIPIVLKNSKKKISLTVKMMTCQVAPEDRNF